MKGDYRRTLNEHLASLFMGAEMKAKVAAVRALHPADSLPDLRAVYINEEDANKVVLTPCLLLFPQGPAVNEAMSLAYQYEFPIDICAFDTPTMEGLSALQNRLYAYQGCVTDLLMSDHSYEAGYWSAVRPIEPIEPDSLVHAIYGELGRVEGYRFGFEWTLDYP